MGSDAIRGALEIAISLSRHELHGMGARGRKVVEERFAWDRIAAEMIACYECVLGEGSKPDCVRV